MAIARSGGLKRPESIGKFPSAFSGKSGGEGAFLTLLEFGSRHVFASAGVNRRHEPSFD
jgi:hypothetical protein